MADDQWRDARVLAAEEALAAAVRGADEIIADATRDPVEPPAAPPSTPPSAPPSDEEPPAQPILRDAW